MFHLLEGLHQTKVTFIDGRRGIKKTASIVYNYAPTRNVEDFGVLISEIFKFHIYFYLFFLDVSGHTD